MAPQANKAFKNPHHLSSKQLAANKANLAKARAAQKGKPRTAKQIAASRHNLAAARAAQKARKSKKQGVTPKKAQAPLLGSDLWLHAYPVCGAVAVAASLQAWTGLMIADGEIWDLFRRAGEAPIAQVLETAQEYGLAGWRLASFEPADPGIFHPALLYGVQLAHGYHAVVAAASGGLLSWGLEIPLQGEPSEAWMLEWAEMGELV